MPGAHPMLLYADEAIDTLDRLRPRGPSCCALPQASVLKSIIDASTLGRRTGYQIPAVIWLLGRTLGCSANSRIRMESCVVAPMSRRAGHLVASASAPVKVDWQ